MKTIKVITILLFSILVLVPLVNFNFTPDAASEIDNRMLTENPFSEESLQNGGDLTQNIESYVNDRIGFRDDMILTYTVLNDKLFGKMVHPNYSYGKDGYVFWAGLTTSADAYSDFHEAFADMVRKLQDYCEEREVPFLFVFNPAKPAVLAEYTPEGLKYDRSWVDQFFEALDARGVRYVDNTQTLREKTEHGEVVFNQKYDANHWNDLGAFYGTNAILAELQKDFPALETNNLEDFAVTEVLQTSLPVSLFPIEEMVPSITPDLSGIEKISDLYWGQLRLHPNYQTFGYYVNQEKLEDGAPRALVFQGSYMIGFGHKFLTNAFGENIYIHDYQNVQDLPYYFNIFKPDCVVFEVAEYTIKQGYFDYEKMVNMDMNPPLSEIKALEVPETQQPLAAEQISVEEGTQLTQIDWQTDTVVPYVWLSIEGEEYDMEKTETGYAVTILTETYASGEEMEITAFDGETMVTYR